MTEERQGVGRGREAEEGNAQGRWGPTGHAPSDWLLLLPGPPESLHHLDAINWLLQRPCDSITS